jgi:hypothetical protein
MNREGRASKRLIIWRLSTIPIQIHLPFNPTFLSFLITIMNSPYLIILIIPSSSNKTNNLDKLGYLETAKKAFGIVMVMAMNSV